jgi:cysteine synthase A
MARNRAYSDVVQTVFDTPLVRLNRLIPRDQATVYVKLEFFNPLSSVKDRIGRAMSEAAVNSGQLTAQTEIIEPTGGNTGIALAFIAAAITTTSRRHSSTVCKWLPISTWCVAGR